MTFSYRRFLQRQSHLIGIPSTMRIVHKKDINYDFFLKRVCQLLPFSSRNILNDSFFNRKQIIIRLVFMENHQRLLSSLEGHLTKLINDRSYLQKCWTLFSDTSLVLSNTCRSSSSPWKQNLNSIWIFNLSER